MAIKGALTTTFAISEVKPTNRNENGYDALKAVEVSPEAVAAASNQIQFTQAEFDRLVTGEPVKFTDQTGLTFAPATTDTVYVVKGSSRRVGFATTFANALAGTLITLTGTPTANAAHIEVNRFKECGEAVSIGEFGQEFQTVRVNNLKTGATRKFKGSFDVGTIQADLLFDSDDVGQTVLESAAESTATYAFHVQLPEAAGDGGEEFYFEGLVASLKRIVGGPDDAVMLRTTIELDHHSIVEGTP